MVSEVFYQNSINNYPSIETDYKNVKNHLMKKEENNDEAVKLIISPISPLRRVSSLPEKLRNGDVMPALGLASLALVNLPEDVRDIQSAYEQAKCFFKGKKFDGAYDYKNFQHDFSFFRGTFLEFLVDLKNAKNKKLAKMLLKTDKTLAATSFGQFILSALNTTEDVETKVMKLNKKTGVMEVVKDINGRNRFAKSYKGPFLGKLTARAMSRTTVLGLAALAIIEMPKIFKETAKADNFFDGGKNFAKQTLKSGVNVASISAGIAYGGAIGAKYLKGPFGSLVGMGIGAVVGGVASEKAQNLI